MDTVRKRVSQYIADNENKSLPCLAKYSATCLTDAWVTSNCKGLAGAEDDGEEEDIATVAELALYVATAGKSAEHVIVSLAATLQGV